MSTEITDNLSDSAVLFQKTDKEADGKLTVFLGAAAGVGKTYTMLETAQDRLAEKSNIVIGWVDTHGRPETEKLAAAFPRTAPKTRLFQETILQEMDLDEILAQKPDIVLVDELAHTNMPGSRNTRRFQDVEELLKNGIDVYTTLNIEHVESLNDIVVNITGIKITETVPDYILDKAKNIQLIDIPPEELIKRLREGKINIQKHPDQPPNKFFRPGNINALRELSLRYTANHVDMDLSAYMKQQNIEGPWPASGRVMVCVSDGPYCAQLIRTARRLAVGLHAELLALHVESPNRRFTMNDQERYRLDRNLRLAEELDGRTITVIGDNLAAEILDAARSHNVTTIVLGKSRHRTLSNFLQGSIADRLIKDGAGINVYVIQTVEEAGHEAGSSGIKTTLPIAPAAPWFQFAGGLGMAAVATVVSWFFSSQLQIVNIALLYLLPVFFTAYWWGRFPSYMTALVSVLTFDFLFVPPIFTFSANDIHHIWSFVIFLIISYFIGGRTEQLRSEAKAARQREKNIRTLYEFSREIAAVADLDHIARKLASHMGESLGRSTRVLLPDNKNILLVSGYHDVDAVENIKDHPLSDSEYAAAVRAYQHGQAVGRSTNLLPDGKYLYVPLETGKKVVGIFGIKLDKHNITPEERQLIYAWVGFAAIAVERVKLTEQANQATLLAEADKLRTALFNSISHELRTPLSTIVGASSILLDTSVAYSEETRRELLESIQEGSNRMERVVVNLLDTARMESGMLHIKNDWCDIEDIVGAALQRIGDTIRKFVIKTELPSGLDLIHADFVLLEQVVVNLVDNAMKYSPAGSTIVITASQEGESMKITFLDNGPGIPEEDLPHIFEKFYRANHPRKIAGTGLGLSICKSIIEAHNGQIWAENRKAGGAAISFSVPIHEAGVTVPERIGD